MSASKARPSAPPSPYDEALHAAEVAFKDKRYETAKKHFSAALKDANSLEQKSVVNYGLAMCSRHLKEEWGQHAKLAAAMDLTSTRAVDLYIKYLESKQDWLQAHNWLKIRLKHTKDEAEKQLIGRKLVEVGNQAVIVQRTANLQHRYRNLKVLRWDIARTCAQTAVRGIQPGDAYFLLPSQWLDNWKAHVGGFADNKDVAAWVRIIKASGKADQQPTDPLVIHHYTQSGIRDLLPTPDELDPTKAGNAPHGMSPDAPAPGTIDCRSILVLGPNADDAPDSDGKTGPRLIRGEESRESMVEVADETWSILDFVYGHVGPTVKRYAVPEVPGDSSKCTIDFYPELERFSGLGAGSADSDVDSPPATVGGSDEEADEGGAGAPAAASSPAAPKTMGPCAVCQKPCDNKCTRCKAVRYCNEECQRKAWPKHKPECADLARQVQAGLLKKPVIDRNGKVGLTNLGNTCFMNSSLQALSSVWPLTSYFIRDEWRQELNPSNPMGSKDNVLAKCYAGLMHKMWLSQAGAVSPAEFKSSIAKFQHRFSGFQQHDAQELLNFLLDGLHEDLNGVIKKPYVDDVDSNGRPDALVAALSWERYCRRNKSRLLDLFAAQLKSTLVCPTCHKVSVKFDPYWAVPLPIPKPGEASIYPLYVDVWLRRMAWEPAMLQQWTQARAGTCEGGADAWAAVRRLAPEELPQGWDAEEDAVTRQGQPSVGISAAFTSQYRFERYAVRVDGEDTTVDMFLSRLSEQCGILPDRLILQCLKAQSAGVDLTAYRFLGTPFTIGGRPGRPVAHLKLKSYAVGYQPHMDVLQAVEVPDPAWRMPDASIPEAVLAQWPGVEAEKAAEAELSLSKAGDVTDQVKEAFLSTRHPSSQVTVLMNVYVPGTSRDVPSDGLYKVYQSSDQAFPGTWSTTVPLVVRMPGAATIAQFRLALAKELFFLLGSAAEALVKRQHAAGAGTEDTDINAADVLLCIASSLHLYAEIAPEGQGPWLPLVDGIGEDAPAPAGAAPNSGAERSANSATLKDCLRFKVYEEEGRILPSFVWSRVAVHIRGDLANLAFNDTTMYKRMPLPDALLPETPSYLVALRIVKEEHESGKQGVQLTACFDRLRKGEILDKDNMWYCGHCKEHVQAEKKLEIWSLPDFLVLQLKRFECVSCLARTLLYT